MIWNREPVLFYALVVAAIGLVSAFGLDLSAEQVAAIETVTLAVLGLAVRHAVTPTGEK